MTGVPGCSLELIRFGDEFVEAYGTGRKKFGSENDGREVTGGSYAAETSEFPEEKKRFVLLFA